MASESFSLDMETTSSAIIKSLFDVLKEIVVDINLEFSANCIKIRKIDVTSTILVNVEIDTDEVGKYSCSYTEEEPLKIGLNILHLNKILKTLNNDDILYFQYDENNPSVFNIKITNQTKALSTKYSLNLLEIDDKVIGIPDIQFSTVIRYNSASFQKKIKDMYNIAKGITFKCHNNQLMMSCKGDFASQETVLEDSGEASEITFIKTKPDEIFKGCYEIQKLLSFSKCATLTNYVQMYMQNDTPLRVMYSIGGIGVVNFYVAPKVDTN